MANRTNIKLGVTSGLLGFGAMFLFLCCLSEPAEGAGNGNGNPFGQNGGGAGGSDDGGGDGGGGGEDDGGDDGGSGGDGGDVEMPEMIILTGSVRDFRERSAPNGHPDFERQPNLGFGMYAGNVAPFLGENNKPVFTGEGRRVNSQWRDNQNRPICHLLYDADAGDVAGSFGGASQGGIQSVDTFNQWFTDVLGMNMGRTHALELPRQPDGTYVFDDTTDPAFSSLGGFFPIEDELLGNPGGSPDRNFHFTFELHTKFVYRPEDDQYFRFVGDDDVWVYVNGQLVIDLGGVHPALDQYVHLNRLELTAGQEYTLDFFFAERHRTQSNFRIQTNIPLESIELPTVSAAFD